MIDGRLNLHGNIISWFWFEEKHWKLKPADLDFGNKTIHRANELINERKWLFFAQLVVTATQSAIENEMKFPSSIRPIESSSTNHSHSFVSFGKSTDGAECPFSGNRCTHILPNQNESSTVLSRSRAKHIFWNSFKSFHLPSSIHHCHCIWIRFFMEIRRSAKWMQWNHGHDLAAVQFITARSNATCTWKRCTSTFYTSVCHCMNEKGKKDVAHRAYRCKSLTTHRCDAVVSCSCTPLRCQLPEWE